MVLLDMEMPESCKDCDLFNIVGKCSVTWKDVTNEANLGIIAESCPIKAEIPKNATNGDVIKAMFPNAGIYEHGSTISVNNEYNFNSTWWNAPREGQKE